jgi:hypothetical protein
MTGVGLTIARMPDAQGFFSVSFLDGLPPWRFKLSPNGPMMTRYRQIYKEKSFISMPTPAEPLIRALAGGREKEFSGARADSQCSPRSNPCGDFAWIKIFYWHRICFNNKMKIINLIT